MKRCLAIAVSILILCFTVYGFFHKTEYEIEPSPVSEKHEAVYQYIHDGDTAVFFLDDGEQVICRFLAIDTPEIGEEGYSEAKSFTDKALEKAAKIVLELDPNSERYDKYDRLLAWVWVDGDLLQASLVENGLAKVEYIYHDYLYLDHLLEIEKNVTREEKLRDDS